MMTTYIELSLSKLLFEFLKTSKELNLMKILATIFLPLFLFACKKQNDLLSSATILMKHPWHLASEHKTVWDSSGIGKVVKSDTTFQATACDQHVKYQFLNDSLLKIDLTCAGLSMKEGKWFLTSDDFLTAIVPVTYNNPGPVGSYFGINHLKIVELKDTYFTVRDTVTYNYFGSAGNGQYSSASLYTYQN